MTADLEKKTVTLVAVFEITQTGEPVVDDEQGICR